MGDGLMRSGKSLLLVTAGLAILAIMTWLLLSGDDEDRLPGDGASGDRRIEDEDVEVRGKLRDGVSSAAASSAVDDTGESGEADREAVAPVAVFVSGQVVDAQSDDPVTVYSITFARWVEHGTDPWKVFLRETVEHEEGRFHFPLDAFPEVRGVKARCWVRSAAHCAYRTDLDIPENEGLSDLRFELDPGVFMAGVVLDDATGKPVAGAKVVRFHTRTRHPYHELFLGDRSSVPHAITNETGRFRLSGQDPYSPPYAWDEAGWRLAAFHPDYAQGGAIKPYGENAEAVIRLKRGHRFHGRVSDDDGHPLEGIMVVALDEDTPVPRAVLSGPDGAYRTAPVAPGPVFLQADRKPEDETPMKFTVETKHLVMKDADQEVHFGPDPTQVTWKGKVYDRFGTLLPNATLELVVLGIDLRARFEHPVHRRAEVDEAGAFEIRKLETRGYAVEIKPTSWAHSVDWGEIKFENPGLIERDLVIRGAEIRGILVDDVSGEPIIDRRAWVDMNIAFPRFRHFSCPADEEGRFRLMGIPEGIHDLWVSARGYAHTGMKDVVVKKDEILENLVIRLSDKGTLEITLSGFDLEEKLAYTLRIRREHYSEQDYGHFVIDDPEDLMITRTFTSVPHRLTLDFGIHGSVARSFTIEPGRTERITILRSEIARPANARILKGLLTDHEGEPVPGIRMFFYGIDVPGLDPNKRYFTSITDGDGKFGSTAVLPGTWTVSATLGQGRRRGFPNLEVPRRGEEPLELHLVLDGGRVTGTLAEAATGAPFTEDGPQWWLFLFDRGTPDAGGRDFGRAGTEIRLRTHSRWDLPAHDPNQGAQGFRIRALYADRRRDEGYGHPLLRNRGNASSRNPRYRGAAGDSVQGFLQLPVHRFVALRDEVARTIPDLQLAPGRLRLRARVEGFREDDFRCDHH